MESQAGGTSPRWYPFQATAESTDYWATARQQHQPQSRTSHRTPQQTQPIKHTPLKHHVRSKMSKVIHAPHERHDSSGDTEADKF
jgi:hypothetical protein